MKDACSQIRRGNTIAVIPARGGSKRIPRKNIKPFCGKPILAYSIAAARATGLFDHIVVSTDDEEIAAVARQWGGETPFLRPAGLADDFAGTNAVAAHAADWFLQQGTAVDHVCCLYATAPLATPLYITKGFEILKERNCPFVFSVTTFPAAVQRALRLDAQGRVSALYPEFMPTRTQDLEEAYHDAAQFYWGSPEAFARLSLFDSGSSVVRLPRHLVADIDTPEDWMLAECLYRTLVAMGEIAVW